jgi:hypothetical protein
MGSNRIQKNPKESKGIQIESSGILHSEIPRFSQKQNKSVLFWELFPKKNKSVLFWELFPKRNKSVLFWELFPKGNKSVLFWELFPKGNKSVLFLGRLVGNSLES